METIIKKKTMKSEDKIMRGFDNNRELIVPEIN
jgi:hypothetical protein